MLIKKPAVVLLAVLIISCVNNKNADPSSTTKTTHLQVAKDSIGYATHWNEKDRDTFMAKCIDGSKGKMTAATANAYCTCMLQKLEAKYPIADSTANISLAEMVQLAKDCLK